MKMAKKRKYPDGVWVLSVGIGSDKLFNEILLSGATVAFAFRQKGKAERSVLGRKALEVAATFIETEPFIGGLMKLPGQGFMDILVLDDVYLPLTKLGVAALFLNELELSHDYPSTPEFIEEVLQGGADWLRAAFDFFLSFHIGDDLPEYLYLLWKGNAPVGIGGQLYVSRHQDQLAEIVSLLHESTEATEELRGVYVERMSLIDLHVHLYMWVSSGDIRMGWFENDYTPYTEGSVDFLITKEVEAEEHRHDLVGFVADLRAAVADVVGIDDDSGEGLSA